MRPLAQHLSREALSPDTWSVYGIGGCFTHTTGILPEHVAHLNDDSAGRAIAGAVSLAVMTTPPRSAYRANDCLGFLWSTVRLLPDEED